jgi:hypothetical protein
MQPFFEMTVLPDMKLVIMRYWLMEKPHLNCLLS